MFDKYMSILGFATMGRNAYFCILLRHENGAKPKEVIGKTYELQFKSNTGAHK